MVKPEAEQARAVFAANRPGWFDEMKRDDAIVVGRNYGMGSNRPASRSLRNIGVSFLIAESINGLFFRNSVNFGFLALECPSCFAAFDEGDTAELDLKAWCVRNARTGAQHWSLGSSMGWHGLGIGSARLSARPPSAEIGSCAILSANVSSNVNTLACSGDRGARPLGARATAASRPDRGGLVAGGKKLRCGGFVRA